MHCIKSDTAGSEGEVAIAPAAVSIKLISRRLIRAFSDVEKPFHSDYAVLTAKSENKKGFFSTPEKARITRLHG